MCGINGALYYGARPDPEELFSIISACADRGRDSCGVSAWNGQRWHDARALGGPESLPDNFLPGDTCAVINTNRAEPTTEWVPEKSLADVQPFRTDSLAIAHNGLVANDLELKARYQLSTYSPIDSAILPPLIERLGLRATLPLLRGSFALAALDARDGSLHLYRSFLPLSLAHRPGAWLFSSETKNLPPHGFEHQLRVEELPPYSGVTIERTGRLLRWS